MEAGQPFHRPSDPPSFAKAYQPRPPSGNALYYLPLSMETGQLLPRPHHAVDHSLSMAEPS